MAYKNPTKDRPYAREYQLQKERGESENRNARARARYAHDKKHGKKSREGLDISHKKPLARGGTNADGTRLESSSTNRARGGAMSKPGTKTGKRKN
jgi:hypothetical protein